MPSLRLLPNADRRLRLGHLWVFSNEVDVAKTPLTALTPGQLAEVKDARNHPVGLAYVNPAALICARMLTTDVRATIDAAWFARRVRRALDLRERVYPTPHYRLVFGESDGVPGLVVDRYGDVLVVQLNTAGTHAFRDAIVEALHTVIAPRGMRLTVAGSVRAMEGLAETDETIGELPERIQIVERGAQFVAPMRGGQKTGFFYDQRDNRGRLGRYVAGRTVLDAYSYVGAWGIAALQAGATAATCVDSSASALAFAAENAERNDCTLDTREGDALAVLDGFAAEGRRFDVVVLDPPALIKRKRDVAAGSALYERVNRAGLRVLAPDGILVSSSCSYHLAAEGLQRVLLRAARAEGRRLQQLERHGQPPDHPVHPAIAETEYLKAFFVRA